jgi:Cu2+-exporting ATPase/Cu+-exporting ATPase
MNSCIHCDENIVIPVFGENDVEKQEPFCCKGCLTVFNIIHQKGLENYYEIKKQSAIFKRRSPVEIKKQQFLFLDGDEFITEFAYRDLNNLLTMEFYLEGIHCLACLWLIEKMPELLPGVAQSRLDMKKSVATVSITDQGKFSEVASELNNLGYRPHVLKRNQSSKDLKVKEERSMQIKIGIAGAGAGNVMLYAISIYAGADGNYEKFFNLLTVIFAFPVLFYSATPFYQTAWRAIKNRTLSIDIPISMALLMGAAFGIYNLFIGIHENFFDSLTALVFLLLLSRYFLAKIQEEGLSASDLSFFYQGTSVLKKEGKEFVEIHPQHLKVHDEIKIQPNEMIPADGVIIQGHTSLNSSLLTGESVPVKADIGTYVYSGTMNIDREIIIRIEQLNQETRIGKILKQVESGWIQKSHIVDLTNKISKHFEQLEFALCTITDSPELLK